jgi:DNA polymerase delta subunit 1
MLLAPRRRYDRLSAAIKMTERASSEKFPSPMEEMAAVSKDTNSLVFQTFAWETDDGLRDGDKMEEAKFSIQMFGRTAEGQSVSARVDATEGGFYPSFCIQVPEACVDTYDQLCEVLRKALVVWDTENAEEGKPLEKLADLGDHLVCPDEPVEWKVNFWGFTNGKRIPFFRFQFKSNRAYKIALSKFRACQRNRAKLEDIQEFIEDYNALEKDVSGLPWDERKAARDEMYEQKRAFIKSYHEERKVSETFLRWALKIARADLPLELVKVKLFEVLDHNLSFAHMGGVRPAGWITIDNYEVVYPEEKETTCNIEIRCDLSDLRSLEQDLVCSALKEMSFDIEAYSHDDSFPKADEPRNCAFQIAVTLRGYAAPEGDMKKILLHLMPAGSGPLALPGVDVRNFTEEADLLIAFRNIIAEEDPDLIWGWNTDSFDWSYLMMRAEVTGCIEEFSKLSRKVDYECKVEHEEFRSGAQGDNEYERVKIPGRLNFDAMTWVKRTIGNEFPDHRLDTVASMKLGETKRDVHYKEIFAAFRSADTERCRVIGDYCVQDTALVQKLVNKLNMVSQIFAMSNITDTPPIYLLSKGQGIKGQSLLTKRARTNGYYVPVAEPRSGDSFEGAVVLEPQVGIYDSPTACLDFASLYPSIMVAYQVCYTTIVLIQCDNCKVGDGPCLRDQGVECYDNLPGVEYETFAWTSDVIVHRNPKTGWRRVFNDADSAKKMTGVAKKLINDGVAAFKRGLPSEWSVERKDYRYRFALGQRSIIPELQIELKKARSAVRKVQAGIANSDDPEDKLRYAVLDGQQLAYKVSGNSLYGLTSAYVMNLQALGACVTARGRQMIQRCVKFANEEFQGLADSRTWSSNDVRTWITEIGREVETDAPQKGWVRKYPFAVEGQPWSWGKALGPCVIGGDTDSTFCNFANCTVSESFAVGRKLGEYVTDVIFNKHPIELEMEAVYECMIILAKKRYAARKYTQDDGRFKPIDKGMATRRRDYCQVVKDSLWTLLHTAMRIRKVGRKWEPMEGPVGDRAGQLLSVLRKVLLGFVKASSVPWSDLVVTSSLKAKYANENLPHVRFARRMNEREKGGGPRVGERFSFVFVHKTRSGDDDEVIAEDPQYAARHALVPNKSQYLNSQMRGALTPVLACVGKGAEAEDLFNEMSELLQNEKRKLRQAREKEAKRLLLAGCAPEKVRALKRAKQTDKLQKRPDAEAGAKITGFFKPLSERA